MLDLSLLTTARPTTIMITDIYTHEKYEMSEKSFSK